MAFVVGINIAIALRLTNLVPEIPLKPLAWLYRPHWVAVLIVLISGLALLAAYPAKALTNPVFYLKLVSLAAALCIAVRFEKWLQQEHYSKWSARLAWISLFLWIITVGAGRFLAYTNSVLLASRFY